MPSSPPLSVTRSLHCKFTLNRCFFLAAIESVLIFSFCGRFLEEEDAPNAPSPGIIYEQYLKCDMSCMKRLTPRKGHGVCMDTVVHLGRKRGEDSLDVLSIDVNGSRVVRADRGEEGGEAWATAKLFAGMNARYMQLYCWHPGNHFRFDAVNAITKKCLPVGHLLYVLLEPHLRHMGILDDTVLNNDKTSPLNAAGADNWATRFYDANVFDGVELRKLVREGAEGTDRLWLTPNMHSNLRISVVYRRYYDVIHAFVGKVLKHLPDDDAEVMSWVAELSTEVVGFPKWEELGHEGLVVVVTNIIWCVSVAHSMDHQTMFNQADGFGNMCLRLPPLKGGKVEKAGGALEHPESAPTFWDTVKQAHFDWMFVTWVKLPSLMPGDSGSLANVKYRFASVDGSAGQKEALGWAAEDFRHGLLQADRQLQGGWKGGIPLPTIHQIAPSVQF